MRLFVRAGLASLAVGATLSVALVAPANAASSRATIAGSVPPWAASASFKGAVSGSTHVAFRLYLGWRNSAGAEALARSVSTPGSSSYRHFLSPTQFRQKFAPTQSDVTAVQRWLHGAGFTVDYTPTNNHYVAAEGTVAEADKAFQTKLANYSYEGKTLLAPEKSLTVPSSLPHISGAIGLDGSTELVHTDHVVADAPPSAGFRNAQPCSAYWAEKVDTAQPGNYPYAPCGYAGSQLQSAYGVSDAIASGNNGSHVTVAIIDAYASPTIVNDVNTYSGRHGLPQFTGSQFSQVVAPGTMNRPENNRQDPQGWYGEETLDVEAVHTMAPGANIVYVSAPNNYQDLDAALNHVVDRKLATIVTNSYGWNGEALPFGFIKPVYDTMLQAVIEGIGVYFSSGDNGDETGGNGSLSSASADWPASSPWVTAVGGTSLAVGAADNYLFETGWETGRSRLASDNTWNPPTYLYGSGGGTSRLFAQPPYQAGIVPTSISEIRGGPAMRAVPDVSMDGDPTTGMRVGQTQTFSDGTYYDEYRIGGTSLSSPLFAGFMALVEQRAGTAIGFANPLIYSTTGLRDVVPPATQLGAVRVDYINGENATDGLSTTLRLLNYDSVLTIHVRPGYDDVTGLGSPTTEFLNSAG